VTVDYPYMQKPVDSITRISADDQRVGCEAARCSDPPRRSDLRCHRRARAGIRDALLAAVRRRAAGHL